VSNLLVFNQGARRIESGAAPEGHSMVNF